jgi:putative NADH-flavin reductase
MKLGIFGAASRTGRTVVRQAQSANHEVVVLAADAERVELQGTALEVIPGKVLQPEAVSALVSATDVVICTLAPYRGSPPGMMTVAAQNIVRAMNRRRARRVVTVVSAAVRDAHDEPSLGRTLLHAYGSTVGRRALQDAEQHVHLLKKTRLDWTVVRAPRVTQGARRGRYRAGYLKLNAGSAISRADLASFVLRLATEGDFIRESPIVSY